MNRYFRSSLDGYLYELEPGRMGALGLLGQGESIDALIDRAIERMPVETNAFVLEVSAQKDVLTVATGVRFKDGWSVMLGADFRKDGTPTGRVEVVKTW